MSYEFVSTETDGRILKVTFNRPEVYNAMHAPMHHELSKVWDAFEADQELWVAVCTGAGDKAFTAGNDLKFTATGQKIDPPDNQRCWDNCLITVETGGLRILHWGDNRHNPPDAIWDRLGRTDILLMPVDDSQHVMGHPHVAEVIERVSPRIVIPHHYFVWNVVQRQSTLLPVSEWLAEQAGVRHLDGPEAAYAPGTLPDAPEIHSFGDNVAFDVDAWHREHGLDLGERP